MNQPFVDRVRKGLKVWSSDWGKLGKVVAVHESSFDVKKGFFFPKVHRLPFDLVRDVQGDSVILLGTQKQLGLRGAFWDMFAGLAGPEDHTHGRRNGPMRNNTPPKEEVRIPVYGEREEPKEKHAAEIIDIEKQPIVREEIQVTKTPGEEPPGTTTVRPEKNQDEKPGQSNAEEQPLRKTG